jgi:DNA-binding NarL/FixJ family response regulator
VRETQEQREVCVFAPEDKEGFESSPSRAVTRDATAQDCPRGRALAFRRPDLCMKLTRQQMVTLHYLLEGKTIPQTAKHMHRSMHTVHDHAKGIYRTLGVSNRSQLILLFVEQGGLATAPASNGEV